MLVAGARPSSAGAAGGGGNVGACVPVVLAGPGGVSGAPLGTIEVCGPPSSDGPSGWASVRFAGWPASPVVSLTGIRAHWFSPPVLAGEAGAAMGCGGAQAPAL